ncbi:MAG: hypothetical protein HYR85_22480, partial [Planctomycetes bacterium]|nr:hypothetical protein [Planctomycetota bacterium]
MDHRPIFAVGRNCWRLEHADRVAFLVDGQAYFGAFARAVERARECILLTAWDIHSRVRLRPGEARRGVPDHVGDFLDWAVSRRRGLHAYVLDWNFAVLYALEREKLPIIEFDWRTHRRLHFRLDGSHPPVASHHQKIAVVDDAMAFAGGFDLSSARWDTSEHRPRDPRRVNPWGMAYPPHHDVQMAVDGDAASALGDLVRDRWWRATGERIPPPQRRPPLRRYGVGRRRLARFRDRRAEPPSDPWPPDLVPDVDDVTVAIARTVPEWEDQPEVREVEALHLDAIAAARRLVFIENQYFTSARIGDALVERLREPNGPEVVVVVPCQCTGWLEESTMGLLRQRLFQRLHAEDRFERFRAYFPVIPGLAHGEFLNVHSKVLIVDDAFLKIGSSNASNRSMGVDTECDLAIEARGDARIEHAIAGLRNRLVGEHLGVRPERVAEASDGTASFIAAIESLRGHGRTLEPVKTDIPELLDKLVPDTAPFDPERPISAEDFLREVLPDEAPRRRMAPVVRAIAILFVLCLIAAAWRYSPLREWIDPGRLSAWATPLAGNALGLIAAVGAFVVAALLMVPVTVVSVVAAILFGPWRGFAIAFSGSLIAGAIAFGVGNALWRDTVRRLAGRRLNRLS